MTDPSSPRREADSEQGYALALVPLAKEIMDYVRAKVPEGTEYAVLLVPSGVDESGLRRTVAMSTDRERMAFYAAQWVLDVHRNKEPG